MPIQALNITSESLCSFACILLSAINIAITRDSINITGFCVVIHIIVFAANAIVAWPPGTNFILCLFVLEYAIIAKVAIIVITIVAKKANV